MQVSLLWGNCDVALNVVIVFKVNLPHVDFPSVFNLKTYCLRKLIYD